MQDEAANHYSLSAVRKNLAHVSDNADFSYQLHRTVGNSFYRLGEEVVFGALLNRYRSENNMDMNPEDLFGDWFEWILEATKILGDIHVQFSGLLLDQDPSKITRKRMHWIPYSMIGTRESPKLPLFFRN